MKQSRDGIPKNVLKEIFPKKRNSTPVSEQIYLHLRRMIVSKTLSKGQRLLRWEFVQMFDVHERIVSEAFSKLRKGGLVISKDGVASFVA